jgi:hypothetical protein
MSMARSIAALQRLTVKDLRTKFAEVFGEATNAHNRDWLIRRIAWRMQALAEGGLSERALARAAELANDADLRVVPPRESTPAALPDNHVRAVRFDADNRLPPPGSVITRPYKGDTLHVKVLEKGFEFNGREYPSLSAVAEAATGSHCNGYLFFRLTRTGGKR